MSFRGRGGDRGGRGGGFRGGDRGGRGGFRGGRGGFQTGPPDSVLGMWDIVTHTSDSKQKRANTLRRNGRIPSCDRRRASLQLHQPQDPVLQRPHVPREQDRHRQSGRDSWPA